MKTTIYYDEEKRTVEVELPNGKRGIAKCCPTDSFSLDVGYTLAYERAIHSAEKKVGKPEKYVPQVGDRVRFKSWEKMAKEFYVDMGGDINISSNLVFSVDMVPLCGTYATIAKVKKFGRVELENFSAKNKDTFWNYSAEMLEKVGKK